MSFMRNKQIKRIQEIEDFIAETWGQFERKATLGFDKYVFRFIDILPTEERPYHVLMSVGFSNIKCKAMPPKIAGAEFFCVMPKDWEFTEDDDYENGWFYQVYEAIAGLLRDNKGFAPGGTLKFTHLHNGSRQNAIVEDILEDKYPSGMSVGRGKSIVFFALQTATEDEYDCLVKDDEEVLRKISSLPCIDFNRASVIDEPASQN